jgi:lipopolysaccharide transport system permease protein
MVAVTDKEDMREMLTEYSEGKVKGVVLRVRWVWSYRYFLQMFVYQRIKAQYAGSILGVLWSLLNPLLMTAVFTVMFTLVTPSHNIPSYPIFLLAGLLPWNFFANATSMATVSIVGESDLIKKVRFPIELLPIASTLSALPNFLGGLLVFAVLALFMGIRPTGWTLLLPILMTLEILFAIGLGFVLATANVFYRDIQAILQVALQAWFFLTPVWYSMDFFPEWISLFGYQVDIQRWLRILNPMASLIAAYRDILYWARPTDPLFLLRTGLTIVLILLIGYLLLLKYCTRFPEEL